MNPSKSNLEYIVFQNIDRLFTYNELYDRCIEKGIDFKDRLTIMPNEILMLVLRKCNFKDIINLSKTCKRFNNLLKPKHKGRWKVAIVEECGLSSKAIDSIKFNTEAIDMEMYLLYTYFKFKHESTDTMQDFHKKIDKFFTKKYDIDVHVLCNLRKFPTKFFSKTSKKKRKTKVLRPPTGFMKPCRISHQMCVFLEIPDNTLVSRPDATRGLVKYIKDNNLQNPANRREIRPDATLRALLNGLEEDAVLTYFNIQKYIKHHFIR